jgi:outer membrane protein
MRRAFRKLWAIVIVIISSFTLPTIAVAQTSAEITPSQNLPAAPQPNQSQGQPTLTPATQTALPGPRTPASRTSSQSDPTLTLQQAQTLATHNNPQISVARLIALASHQATREVRSNLWPTASVNMTGVDAESGNRITAGGLNNPIVYERAAAGATVSQLIYDFGRSTNLVASANLAEKAQAQDAAATREQILLAVSQAFYEALQTQAVVTVAEQTVSERETVANQINELFKNELKSGLDLSFANVNLAQAKLLLLDAQNSDSTARANLSMLMGFASLRNYQLLGEQTAGALQPPPANVDDLIATAFAMRPEILALQFQAQSANKFRVAERDLLFPNIRALGVIGGAPFGNAVVANTWYGAVGANMEIPVFNGFLYTARAHEARLRTEASDERLRAMRDQISRDVRTGWLNANAAYQKLDVTRQLLDQANLGLSLAKKRYQMGLSSIVELSQAQLQETQAEISSVQAGYNYQLALATLTYETKGF